MSTLNYAGVEELVDNSKCLISYNRDIAKLLVSKLSLTQSRLHPRDRYFKILDYGAGIGTLSTAISALGIQGQFFCVEPDMQLWNRLPEWVTSCASVEECPNQSMDLVFSSNVLEHIEDDAYALALIANKVCDHGFVSIYVPAMPILWTRMDTKVGHFRRYTRKTLKRCAEQAELEIIDVRYVDSFGALFTFFYKIYEALSAAPDYTPPSRNMLKFYDRFIWPVSKVLDPLFSGLFGKNLILHARPKRG